MKRVKLKGTNKNGWSRDYDGRFRKGTRGGPGRRLGIPNKITSDMRLAIIQGAEMVGFDGKGLYGARGYMARLALYDPDNYTKLATRVLPFIVTGNLVHRHEQKYETIEDLEKAFAERGLPSPQQLIELNARPAGMKRESNGQIIDAE